MAWPIRSAAEFSALLRGAFRRYLPGTDTSLRNNVVTVIVKVMAALAHEFDLRMGALSRQMFLSTATDIRWVALHAADVGIYRKPASVAAGMVNGTGAAFAVYPAGIRFVSGTITYVTTAPVTADADGALIAPVASDIRGAAANRDAGGLLSLADPALFPELSLEWIVGGDGIGGGADVEDIEALRSRGLARKRNPPGGGTLVDYERVALTVPGVLRAWAFRTPAAPGMLVVHILFAGRLNYIPSPADVLVVQAAIDAKRLIRVDNGIVTAPVARAVDVEIAGLSSDTPEIRESISVALRGMFLDRCRPGVVSDPFLLSRSWLSEAISAVAGEDRHRLLSPADDILLTDGEFPTLGVVTYVA